MHRSLLAAMLLGLCVLAAGCRKEVTRAEVTNFVDKADAAARKRFAPEICELRAKDFTLKVRSQGPEKYMQPTELEMSRKLYCQQAGQFSRLRQYRLERKSLDIEIASDRKTARVVADYTETLPYYPEGTMPATPDDFRDFQVVESHDESLVGFEDGDLVFLWTKAESSATLTPKGSLQIPYD